MHWHWHYCNTGCGVFKRGVQNEKDFCVRINLLNSQFVWNWCNANPVKITKSNHLWLRGFVSIMLNLILRVFAISAFLKVIHAPKTLKKPQERGYFRYPENNLPTYIFWNPRNRNFSWTIYSPPYHWLLIQMVKIPRTRPINVGYFLPKIGLNQVPWK